MTVTRRMGGILFMKEKLMPNHLMYSIATIGGIKPWSHNWGVQVTTFHKVGLLLIFTWPLASWNVIHSRTCDIVKQDSIIMGSCYNVAPWCGSLTPQSQFIAISFMTYPRYWIECLWSWRPILLASRWVDIIHARICAGRGFSLPSFAWLSISF